MITLTVFFLPFRANADSARLDAIQDATLFEDVTGSKASGSGSTLFLGDNQNLVTRRALVQFDVAASLPAGTKVRSAELWLHVSDAPNAIDRNVMLYRVLAEWGEGVSSSGGGGGAAAEPHDATWIHRFYPGRSWINPGGDFAATAGAATVVGASGWHSWSGDSLTQDVQAWLDDPRSNFGWLLMGEEGVSQSARGFDSRESAQPELRPYLIVEFGGTSVPTQAATLSSVKAKY